MKVSRVTPLLLAGLGLMAVSGCSRQTDSTGQVATAPAQSDAAPAAAKPSNDGSYLPDPGRKYPERVLWGDQHVHTGWSFDAGIAGATLTPEDAVRFGRG